MKSYNKFFVVVVMLLLTLVLVACVETKLTSIEFEGVGEVSNIAFDSEFNVLTGVKAIGNDEKDYSDKITITSTSAALNKETGELNTKSVGDHQIQYNVEVEGVKRQVWRKLTVLAPERTGDDLIQNGDFSQELAYWTGDQGTIDLSVEDGALKAVVVAGGDAYQPRVWQMEVPFKQNQSYKISFQAKSSVAKTINLQVGELLDNAPWFTDFKTGQIVHKALTTEWATYDFTFRHTLENERGGLLFEFGKVADMQVDATIWLKDVKAEAVADEADTEKPTLSGATDAVLLLGTTFDPMAGVTAFDVFDGDVTPDIEYVIKDASGAVVTEIDVDVAGVYTITYTVSDKAGNSDTAERTVTFEEMKFKDENLIVNGDFEVAIDEEWTLFTGEGAAATTSIVDGKLVIDVTALGGPSWAAQYFQEGFSLAQGKTYKLSFDASASVARDINVALGVALTQDPWFANYMDMQAGVALTTAVQTFEFIFTVSEENTDMGKLVFEVGNTEAGAIGTVSIDNVKIQERDVSALIDPDFTTEGHVLEQASGDTHATAERTVDELEITVISVGGDAYIPHYFYLLDGLEAGTYVFKLSVSGSVARHLRFNIVLPDDGFVSLLPEISPGVQAFDFLLVADEVYELEVEFVVADPITSQVKIELDFGPLGYEGETLLGVFTLSDILLYRK